MTEINQEIGSECPLCKSSRALYIGSKNGTGGDHDYHKCIECDLIYAPVMPTPEMFDESYQGDYTVRSITRKTIKLTPVVTYLKIKKRLRGEKGKVKFLDIGSNAGYFTEAARKLGCDAYGLELDEKAVAFAQEHYPGSQFRAESIEEFSEKGHIFDLIYCSEVIEHVPDIHSFVKAIRKVANEKTIFFLTTPDSGHFKMPKNLISWHEIIPVQHIRLFNKKNLAMLLKEHGFRVKFSIPMLRANQRLFCKTIK